MGTLHLIRTVLDAPPEVSGTDDQTDLDTHVHAGFDGFAKLVHNGKIKPPMCVPGESLAADFQQDALIFKLRQNEITPYLHILSYSSVSSPN